MHTMTRGAATHSHRLEKWLGAAKVADISRASRDFYWPIPVHGVPGRVFAMPGGDFAGEIRAGSEVSGIDRALITLDRFKREQRAVVARHRLTGFRGYASDRNRRAHAFPSMSALVAAATGGKAANMWYLKTGVAVSAIGGSEDMWTNGTLPSAGAAGAAAPGGTASTSATTGALAFPNAVSTANTSHFTTGYVSGNVVSNTLMLYDRLFSVAKTMNSTATEAVTGTFARYQSTTPTAANYAGGNFLFPSNPTTVLAATAHNWTVCKYTNQAGTTGQSAPSATGISACPVHQIDLAVGGGSWFMPLAAGDIGVQALTQMQCSATVATGTIDFVVGHPIAYFPVPVINFMCVIDGINTAFNLATIYDNACLAFLEMPKPAVTATTYTGQIATCSE